MSRNIFRRVFRRYANAAFLLAVAIVALRSAGCGYRVVAPPAGTGNNSASLQVSVTPKTASLQTSATALLTASVTHWVSDSTVRWQLIPSGMGTLDVHGNGVTYNAPQNITVSPTLVTVRAISNEDTSKHADAVIAITTQIVDTSHMVALVLSPVTVTLQAGQTQQFFVSVTGTTNTLVTWQLMSGPGSISELGLYIAPASVTPSSHATIRATSLADTTVWREATITLMPLDTTPCFTRDIYPVILSNCTMSGCHDGSDREAHDMRTYAGIMTYVSAGHASASRLYKAITTVGGEDQMPRPPRQRLSQAQIDLIKRWINDGAKNSTCPDSGPCDTVAVSYKSFIAPTIQNYCLGCHSGSNPSGSIDLSTYNGVLKVAASGQLVGGLTGTPPNTQMPQGGSPLDACTIARFRAWVTQGAQNN
jgi:hypothetical protein